MAFHLAVSVLDQSPIPEGQTASDALHNTIDLARWTDSLGYRRFWLAEHHGTPGLACNSPEVLIGPVAAATSRMRIGSGGVMLPHYSPLKVAENFKMLNSLYPGRIDLGIGRAAGTSAAVAFALQRDRRQPSPDDFPEQFNELLSYLKGAGNSAKLLPQYAISGSNGPEVSLLGSSLQSAIWAAELGLPYVFADFINPNGVEIAQTYLERFEASEYLAKPRLSIAAWAICAETDEEAVDLSLSMRMMMVMLYRGRPVAVPSVEKARAFVAAERMPLDMIPVGRRLITGTPARVRKEIESLAAEYGAEEVFLINILHSHAARRRSYELIAHEFGLKPGAAELTAITA